MIHKTIITPLNCACYSASTLQTFVTTTETAYNARTDRAIYFKNPLESWFKLKAGTATSFLEPFAADLKEGDVVSFEFDIAFLNGTAGLRVSASFESAEKTSLGTINAVIDTTNLPPIGQFKRVRVDMVMYNMPTATKRCLFNIRPTGINTETIIKNAEMIVDTSNSQFSMQTDIVRYTDAKDYRTYINNYALTNLEATFAETKVAYDANPTTVVNGNEVNFIGIPATQYKGLMAHFVPNPNNTNVIICCFEYQATATSTLYDSAQLYDVNGTPMYTTGRPSQEIPIANTNGEWVKVWKVLNAEKVDAKNLLTDIGIRSAVGVHKTRNVYFSSVRFDAQRKGEPNKIADMFNSFVPTT